MNYFITFDFVEGTSARKYKEKKVFLWYFARLIVPLHYKCITNQRK